MFYTNIDIAPGEGERVLFQLRRVAPSMVKYARDSVLGVVTPFMKHKERGRT